MDNGGKKKFEKRKKREKRIDRQKKLIREAALDQKRKDRKVQK
jgi:hypothetical protein